MVAKLFRNLFGTSNDRFLKSVKPIVSKVNDLEARFEGCSDEDLRRYTYVFKERLEKGESLDSILFEAFAVVREAAKRTLGMRHYDVQLVGGTVLHRGMIAEMRTGEGKTLVATLPAYLNALTGSGVHVVTVNDYLAKRDAEWMGQVYRFLGLNVGCVYSGMNEADKKNAYQADITYGQNNEFGFDYLRDNLKFSKEHLVQRGHAFAIIDEVDSILIDEARTPLIISGPAEDSSALYTKVNKIIPKLIQDTDYEIDLKLKQPTLTDDGIAHAEQLLGIDNLYDPSNIEALHHVNQSLRAHTVMQKDVDYVVKGGQIIIVDEFTGRLMPGRRWSDGLHQAIEAKEKVKIARENVTLASISFQNLFRLYNKLSGMTGTAVTEATEFKTIYNLDVIVIPTNLPMVRDDAADVIFRTSQEKYQAVVEEIVEANKKGQPVLVGTTSIEQSEFLSKSLEGHQIAHHVLNAKQHAQEATIVAQAGRLGAVTIATNMAGRGTDIVLGGNPPEEKQEVLDAGGLCIIGTERHESRRIDNQLRGRAGRQGDPGKSQFYISLEDDLMKRFGGDRYQTFMKRMGWEEGMAIDSRIISRTIENAQSRVERHYFEARKHFTEYDDVLNKQRKAIYTLRNKVLDRENVREEVLTMLEDLIEEAVLRICNEETKPNQWNLEELTERYQFLCNAEIEFPADLPLEQQAIFDFLRETAKQTYQERAAVHQEAMDELKSETDQVEGVSLSLSEPGSKFDFQFSSVEQETMLEDLDRNWNSHLQQMEFLREGITLRSYAQQNPLHEYQKEGFGLFSAMMDRLNETVVRTLFYFNFDKEHFLKLLEHIKQEQERRAEIERQMELAGQEQESGKDSPTSFQPKDPEEVRAKMQERRKMRRKRR